MLPFYNVLVMGTYMLLLYSILEASRLAYRRTIGFWRTVIKILYSRVNYLIDTKRGGAVLIQ